MESKLASEKPVMLPAYLPTYVRTHRHTPLLATTRGVHGGGGSDGATAVVQISHALVYTDLHALTFKPK